jgi:death-on-curing protein
VLRIHEQFVRQAKCEAGLLHSNLLDSALAMPRQGFFGVECHPQVWEKAAAYLFHITMNHAFVDCNKRTAVKAAILFLSRNRYICTAGNEQIVELVTKVAAGRWRKEDVASFLQVHTIGPSDTHGVTGTV